MGWNYLSIPKLQRLSLTDCWISNFLTQDFVRKWASMLLLSSCTTCEVKSMTSGYRNYQALTSDIYRTSHWRASWLNDNYKETNVFRNRIHKYWYRMVYVWQCVGNYAKINRIKKNMYIDVRIRECYKNIGIWGDVPLTHWGRVTHICVSKLTIIGSDNGMSPGRRQAIIWTNAGILLMGPLGTNFGEILVGIQTFCFRKMHLKMSSAL